MKNLRKKEKELSSDGMLLEMQRSFFNCMNDYPDTLKYDLFNYFSSEYEGREAADLLSRVVELFEMDYEIYDEIFTPADWDLIREAVSDCAIEIDQNVLTYVMKLIVSKGIIG
jgi:hypothetical protein